MLFVHTPFATQVNNVGIDTARYLDINADIYTREGIEAAKEKVTSRDVMC